MEWADFRDDDFNPKHIIPFFHDVNPKDNQFKNTDILS